MKTNNTIGALLIALITGNAFIIALTASTITGIITQKIHDYYYPPIYHHVIKLGTKIIEEYDTTNAPTEIKNFQTAGDYLQPTVLETNKIQPPTMLRSVTK